MLRRAAFLLPLVCIGLLALAADDNASQVYKQVVRGTVLIETPGGGFGSGWIVDRERRLIITNYHVVLKNAYVQVVFPQYKSGELVVEKKAYAKVTRYKGRVIDALPDKDLACVRLEDEMPEGTTELKMAEKPAAAAERVHSVGNPAASSGLWVYTSGTVRQVFQDSWHYLHLRSQIKQNCAARIMQTQSPTNGGDSGGPVVNDRGELIATTSGNDTDARIITHFIDISEVRPFVIQARRIAEPKTVSDYVLRGERFMLREQYDDAVAAGAAAIKLDAKSAAAHRCRGQAFYEKSDYDTALVDLDQAIQLDANDALAHYYRAACHYFNDKTEPALKDVSRAIALDAKLALAYNLRGVIYEQKKEDYVRAIADYTRSIDCDPKEAVTWANRASANLAQKEYDKAIADAQAALLIDPFGKDPWLTRGRALREKKLHDDQIRNFAEALKFLPDDAELWSDLGDAWTWKDDWAKSVPCYAKAIELAPERAYSYRGRGQALEELDRIDEAQPDYKKALELDPDEYKPQLDTYDTSYVRVHNDTNQTLKVYMQYEHKTKEGKWVWYPQDPAKAPSWSFKPGEKAKLQEDDWTIHCRRCRIWAVAGDTAWNKFKNADWEVVPKAGFLAKSRPVLTMRFF